jgi:hypothetical protein
VGAGFYNGEDRKNTMREANGRKQERENDEDQNG